MAFVIKIENPVIAKIINSLEKSCSVFTFDFSEHGLGLNVSDDNNSMGISILLGDGHFSEYEFTGNDMEKISLNGNKLSAIIKRLTYPYQIESTMDGGIRLLSEVGRQSYKQNTIDSSEKYHNKSEVIKGELEKLTSDDSAIVIKIMHQDVKDALLNIDVDSKNVIIALDGDKLHFMADSMEVEAEATAPLIEAVVGDWKMTYNISYFKSLLNVIGENRPLRMFLYPDRRSFVIDIDYEEEGGYCRLSLAPVLQRRTPVEEDFVEDEEEDELESELD